MAAVMSISAYIERADYFWIVAPLAEHKDTRSQRNFHTYRKRGWCRLEECANLLSKKAMMPLVITEAPLLASYTSMEFMFYLAGNADLGPPVGEATCCEVGHVGTLN